MFHGRVDRWDPAEQSECERCPARYGYIIDKQKEVWSEDIKGSQGHRGHIQEKKSVSFPASVHGAVRLSGRACTAPFPGLLKYCRNSRFSGLISRVYDGDMYHSA